jgi:hypothetical protein
LSTTAAILQYRKPKALLGPKTYVNDAYIDLHLHIASQLCWLKIHQITNVLLKKQGKVDLYQVNVLFPNGCLNGLQPYNCDNPSRKS